MTRQEQLSCLTDRPCAVCKYHSDNGCTQWKCVFEEQPCGDAISRQAVKEQMIKYGFHASDMTVTEFVETLPTVSTKKTGHWGKEGECPFCGYFRKWEDDNFCGNCGAKMVESEG